MHTNKALNDRTLSVPSINDNAVMMHRKLMSLINQYNMLAKAKGLPIKSIPIYGNNVNHTLMSRSMINLIKDIDSVKNIKEEDEEGGFKPPTEDKTLKDVEFTNGAVNDGIWTYTVKYGKVTATLNADGFSNSFTGDSVTLSYEHMPYEKLIDKDGNEYPVTSYYRAFRVLPQKVTTLTIQNWTNRNVTNMNSMFYDCKTLTSLTLGKNFYTNAVTNMGNMFNTCSAITSLSFEDNFNASNVEVMSGMFAKCSSLTALSLGDNFNTSAVVEMSGMFAECSSLTALSLGKNFYITEVAYISSMFYDSNVLKSVSLYKKSSFIINTFPLATWNVTNESSTKVGEVTISPDEPVLTWSPSDLLDRWGDNVPWTLSRTIPTNN